MLINLFSANNRISKMTTASGLSARVSAITTGTSSPQATTCLRTTSAIRCRGTGIIFIRRFISPCPSCSFATRIKCYVYKKNYDKTHAFFSLLLYSLHYLLNFLGIQALPSSWLQRRTWIHSLLNLIMKTKRKSFSRTTDF